MAKESIDKVAKLLAESLPIGLRSVRNDLEQTFRSVLQNSIEKLDLVTREEFEAQEAVLAQTRDRFEELESRLGNLENSALPEDVTSSGKGL